MKRKTDPKHLEMKVGIFTLASIALVIIAVLMLGGKPAFLRDEYELFAYFDDITGLGEGSQVKLAGIPVGVVENITFEDLPMSKAREMYSEETVYNSGGSEIKKTGIKVKTILKLNKRYQDRIRRDSVASITTQGLLGDGMIYLSVGSRKSPILKDGERIIHTRNPQGFEQLKKKGEALMKDAEVLLNSTNQIADEVNAALKQLNEGSGLAHAILYDAKGGAIIRNANAATSYLSRMSENFSSISNKIDEGQGTLGRLVNSSGIHDEVSSFLGKVNRGEVMQSIIRYTLSEKEEAQSKQLQ